MVVLIDPVVPTRAGGSDVEDHHKEEAGENQGPVDSSNDTFLDEETALAKDGPFDPYGAWFQKVEERIRGYLRTFGAQLADREEQANENLPDLEGDQRSS
ncbi:hypothetical protein TNCV_3362221 [Trichonephila clavipes]|nr:hypothetical protein TNCV_3362221 [Trichonephila clavipes]